MIESINIHKSHLAEQLGENGIFTETAVYDPGIDEKIIHGIFDENTHRADKSGKIAQEPLSGARFVIYDKLDFDIYDNKILLIERTGKEYKIQYQDTDEKGVQVLWLI